MSHLVWKVIADVSDDEVLILGIAVPVHTGMVGRGPCSDLGVIGQLHRSAFAEPLVLLSPNASKRSMNLTEHADTLDNPSGADVGEVFRPQRGDRAGMVQFQACRR